MKLSYIDGHDLIYIANAVFGYNGWSSEIKAVDVGEQTETTAGTWTIAVRVTMRVTLSPAYGGAWHEEIGFGTAEKLKRKPDAMEKATKEASTDALKRCLRLFGESTGNCMYNKDFVQAMLRLRRERLMPDVVDEDSLYRDGNDSWKRRRVEVEGYPGTGLPNGVGRSATVLVNGRGRNPGTANRNGLDDEEYRGDFDPDSFDV